MNDQQNTNDLYTTVSRITPKSLSAEARSHITDAITDCIGCAIGGSQEALAASLLETLVSAPEASLQMPARMLGNERFATSEDAALYNGTIAHALDYDDFSHPAYSHPSVVLVPALLACLPLKRASGAEMIAAYASGLQVYGKLGRALNTGHYLTGWHATATFGALAGAAAAARLVGLDRDAFWSAIGIAASSAAGLRVNFGTMTKPLHAGIAARNAVMAVRLASAGFTASPDALMGEKGFVEVFSGKSGIRREELFDWSTPIEIETEFGLNLKPYPACAATHTAIEAAISLQAELRFTPQDVASITVGASQMAIQALVAGDPTTPLAAKFSMGFCVAAAIVEDNISIETFEADRLNDPDIRALLPRIKMVDDERVRDHSELGSVVTVTLKDGRVAERELLIATGKPERWFDKDRLLAKFLDCTTPAMPEAQARAIFTRFQSLEALSVASALLD